MDEWLAKAEAQLKEHESMLVSTDGGCIQCLREAEVSNLLILDIQIEGKDVPDHKTVATMVCSNCHKYLNQEQILKNMNFLLLEFNCYIFDRAEA